ncbi:hypothetical protein M0R36_10850 [bacterium]|jgi:hypothetical protein|nr:hypothetical protein [bacterium]
MIGCDPEFGYTLLNKEKEKIIFNGNMPPFKTDIIGWDHGGKVVELRPKPGSPMFVVTQIGLSLRAVDKTFKNHLKGIETIVYHSGGFGEPSSGGHIHIDKNKNKTINDKMKNAIEKWDKLNFLDCEPGRESRLGRGYGKHGEYRDDHDKSIEWRTPSSWLSDPRWAFSILSVVYSVYFSIDRFEKTVSNHKQFLKFVKSTMSPKEWNLFYPYYNMWNSYRLKNKKLPKDVNMDKWDEFLNKVPRSLKNRASNIINKYLEDCKINVTV